MKYREHAAKNRRLDERPRRRRRSSYRRWLTAAVVVAAIALLGAGGMYAASVVKLMLPHPQPIEQAAAPPLPPKPQLPPTGLYAGTRTVPVIMYHDVTDKPSIYFDTTVREFRKHLELLKKTDAHVVPLADLYDHLANGKPLPSRPVVLTFDDCYLGQYENAYPLLKEYNYPATFFVQTGFVGKKTSRDHMSWEQLQELDKGGLIDVEDHTITHPDDLRKLSDPQLHKELVESKAELEKQLGRKVRFLAYPVGNANGRVCRVAHEAGYEMAFTMGPGWVRSPEDALYAPRMLPKLIPEVCTQLKLEPEEDGFDAMVTPVIDHTAESPEPGTEPGSEAAEESGGTDGVTDAGAADGAESLPTPEPLVGPIRPQVVDLKAEGLESGSLDDGPVEMRWVKGGRLSGIRMLGRRDVPTMVHAAGATAGLNGTFFSDARVNSAGEGIVGPVMSRFGPGFAPGLPGDRDRIAGRPLVIISKEKMAFLPFSAHLALDADAVDRLLPGATDCFMAGAWLVHQGHPLDHDRLDTFRLTNIFDARPRAFMGVDREGRPFLGASYTGNPSDQIARRLAAIGLQECVLLDSGFSTSLVLGNEILITGIRRDDMPARPVPHFLVLHAVDPKTDQEVLATAPPNPRLVGPPEPTPLERLKNLVSAGGAPKQEETGPPALRSTHRHRRRRRHR